MKYTWLILIGILCLLFFKSFIPDYVLASNDGPFGAMAAQKCEIPTTYYGCWDDLNWIGSEGMMSPVLSVSSSFRTLCFYPLSLIPLFIVGYLLYISVRKFSYREACKRIFFMLTFGWPAVLLLCAIIGPRSSDFIGGLISLSGLISFIVILLYVEWDQPINES